MSAKLLGMCILLAVLVVAMIIIKLIILGIKASPHDNPYFKRAVLAELAFRRAEEENCRLKDEIEKLKHGLPSVNSLGQTVWQNESSQP